MIGLKPPGLSYINKIPAAACLNSFYFDNLISVYQQQVWWRDKKETGKGKAGEQQKLPPLLHFKINKNKIIILTALIMFFKNKKNQLAIQQKLKEVQVGNYKILADKKHPIEEYLKAHKYYSRNLARIAKLMERKYPQFSIVDVGANIGDTIALLRSAGVNQIVYAIEGDPVYFEIMKLNLPQFKDAEVFLALLGEENKTEQLYIDKSEGTGKVANSFNKVQVEKLDDIASKYQFKNIKLLKTDTDGFDLKIIRGSFEIIKVQQPVLFFEYDAVFLEEQNENGADIFVQLKRLGYNNALFYDNYGKLLLSLTIDNTATILQLYSYMKKREGAFEYFDVCVFHEKDNDMASQILEEEMKFFN